MLNPETLCLKVLKNRKAYRTSLVQACVGQAARKPKKPRKKNKKKPSGSSNAGEYKRVKTSDFAGPSGGSAAGSFPVNTIERGRAALRLAFRAPNPEGIREFVYKKYPSLRP
tara:strand:+ start:200 stop:535 length:336 start_codon:yes stop_codon:yes gene_type:complete